MSFIRMDYVIKKICFFMMIINPVVTYGFFKNYNFFNFYRDKEFDKAQTILMKELVDSPNDPEKLYNSGVVAYRCQDFYHAKTYFENAVLHTSRNNNLYIHSFFNHGNCCLHLKEYEKAIESYDHVLEVDPQNERALYNKNKALGLLKKEEYKKHDNPDSQDSQEKEQQKEDKNSENNSESHDQSQGEDNQLENQNDASENENSENSQSNQDTSSQGSSEESTDDREFEKTPQENPEKNKKNDKQGNEDHSKEQNETESQDKKNNGEEKRDNSRKQTEQHEKAPNLNDSMEKDKQHNNEDHTSKKQNKKDQLYASPDLNENNNLPLSEEELLLVKIDEQDKTSGKNFFKSKVKELNYDGNNSKNW